MAGNGGSRNSLGPRGFLTEEEKRRASITSQIEELERLNEEGLITDEQKTEILLATVQSEEDLQYLYDQHVISLEQMKD